MRKEPFKHLIHDKRYTIVKAFTDYDGKPYRPGRIYTFLGSDFLPYEDGLTLRFKQAGQAIAIRLQWQKEAQMEIIESLEDYFVLAVR